MKKNEAYNFLNLFRKDEEDITISLLHEDDSQENKYPKNMTYFNTKLKQLKKTQSQWSLEMFDRQQYISTQNKKLGKAVFFIPNNGGEKAYQIKDVRAYFIDYDIAKVKEVFEDKVLAEEKKLSMIETGEFIFVEVEKSKVDGEKTKYTLKAVRNQKTVKILKDEFLENHKNELKNTVIVETFAGFHVYWILSEPELEIEKFKSMQIALAKKFNGDYQVNNLSRNMRIPGFLHIKYKKFSEEFLTRVIQWTDKKWTTQEIMQVYKLDLESTGRSDAKEDTVEMKHISEMNIEFREKIYSPAKEKEMSLYSFIDWVKRQPLDDFISSSDFSMGAVKCPFHYDEKKSGSVFKTQRGEIMFKCHATGCSEEVHNVISLYLLGHDVKYLDAVENLADIAEIKIIETDFQRKMMKKYQLNRKFLREDLETFYPNIEHWISRFGRISYLRELNDVGETSFSKDEFQYNGHNIFYVSYREIMRNLYKSSIGTIYNTLKLLNMLGFIERIPFDNLPKKLKDRANKEKNKIIERLKSEKEEAKNKGNERRAIMLQLRIDNVREINFYYIPSWHDAANEIEQRAKLLREKKFTFKNNLSKKGLAITYGEEFANRIYPDERKIPKTYQRIAKNMTEYVQQEIKKEGFFVLENIKYKSIRSECGKRFLTTKEKIKYAKELRAAITGDTLKAQYIRSDEKKKKYGYKSKSPNQVTLLTKIENV